MRSFETEVTNILVEHKVVGLTREASKLHSRLYVFVR